MSQIGLDINATLRSQQELDTIHNLTLALNQVGHLHNFSDTVVCQLTETLNYEVAALYLTTQNATTLELVSFELAGSLQSRFGFLFTPFSFHYFTY